MKILIAYQYFSFKGGIEHVISAQAKLFAKDGNQVKVLTSEYLDNMPLRISEGVPIHRVKSINYFYTKLGIPFAIPYPTFKNLKTFNYLLNEADVINVHGHPYIFSFIVILLAKHKKKTIVLTQHNTKLKPTSKIVEFICNISDRTIGYYNITRSNAIICVSNETKSYVESVARKKVLNISTVYNGIDGKRFTPSKDKLKLRNELILPKDKFICLTVRRITFKNGIDTLLSAADACKNQNVIFVIGGTGPDLDDVKKVVEKKKLTNIKILGLVGDSDLPKYYAASDAFILPSRQGEGFPMVVLEAFSSGIPVIATKSGGHTEVIHDSVNGFLVDPEEPIQIVEKIEQLLLMDHEKIATECRNLIESKFTWRSNIRQINKVFEEGMHHVAK